MSWACRALSFPQQIALRQRMDLLYQRPRLAGQVRSSPATAGAVAAAVTATAAIQAAPHGQLKHPAHLWGGAVCSKSAGGLAVAGLLGDCSASA